MCSIRGLVENKTILANCYIILHAELAGGGSACREARLSLYDIVFFLVLHIVPTDRRETNSFFYGSFHRNYIVVPMAKVSPSMTGGRVTAWKKNVGEYVECYELLYEFDVHGVTDDDNFDKATPMEVECCEEGFLALIFNPTRGL